VGLEIYIVLIDRYLRFIFVYVLNFDEFDASFDLDPCPKTIYFYIFAMSKTEDNVEKDNPVNGDEVALINILKNSPKGLVDADIQIAMPALSPTDRVALINSMLSNGLIDLFNQGGR